MKLSAPLIDIIKVIYSGRDVSTNAAEGAMNTLTQSITQTQAHSRL